MKVNFLVSPQFEQHLLNNRHAAVLDRYADDWQDVQIELIEALESELKACYGQEAFDNDEVFISSNLRPAKVLHLDIYDSLLSASFVTGLIDFLQRNAPDYAVLSSINHLDENMVDSMTGQFYVNLREVCVEESARAIWDEKVSQSV